MNLDTFYYENQPREFDSPILAKEGTYKWRSTDSEKNWQRLLNGDVLEKHREYIKDDSELKEFIEYYTENPIEYKFNSNGFRDDELDSKPKEVDVYLGCSFTNGIGLHKEKIWPSLLSSELNFPSINAGIDGVGVITQYRTLMFLYQKFKIRNVFHFMPLTHVRWEWYNSVENKYYNWKIGHPNPAIPLAYIENISLQVHVFLKGMRQVCSEHNTNYINVTEYPEYTPTSLIENRARDLHHRGFEFHKVLTKKFIEQLPPTKLF